MQFKKIHFVLFLLLNLMIPVVFSFISKGTGSFEFGDLAGILIAILIVSFLFFFICWFLYYVITRGKEPSIKFHLLSQCLVTLTIFFLFGWIIYSRLYPDNYESNSQHNKYFLETKPSDGFLGKYDSLYRKGFALLEQKMNDKNDIRLEKRVKKGMSNIITGNINEEVCVFYFTYTFKNSNQEFASKHVVGSNTNKLVFHNVPLSSLKGLQALITNKNTSIKESVENGTVAKEVILPPDSINSNQ